MTRTAVYQLDINVLFHYPWAGGHWEGFFWFNGNIKTGGLARPFYID